MPKKHNEKFEAIDVPILIARAKGIDASKIPEEDRHSFVVTKGKHLWLKTLEPIEARDELEFRFRRIVATLVNVCITGRPNYWSSYQRTFLQMFAGKATPIEKTASMLKRELCTYEKEELFSTGQLAVLLAVDRCETSFVSTIVICFKDLIYKMIKDPNNRPAEDISTEEPFIQNIENLVAFQMFLDSLTEEEWIVAQKLIDGSKATIPASLKTKLGRYKDY